jgi:hypothetical protein
MGVAIAGIGDETQKTPELLAAGSRVQRQRPLQRVCMGQQILGQGAPDSDPAEGLADVKTARPAARDLTLGRQSPPTHRPEPQRPVSHPLY